MRTLITLILVLAVSTAYGWNTQPYGNSSQQRTYNSQPSNSYFQQNQQQYSQPQYQQHDSYTRPSYQYLPDSTYETYDTYDTYGSQDY